MEDKVQQVLDAIKRIDAHSLAIRKGQRISKVVCRYDRGGTAFMVQLITER